MSAGRTVRVLAIRRSSSGPVDQSLQNFYESIDEQFEFVTDYNVTRQTMAMLLSVSGNSFFTTYRQKKSKNKSVEEISEFAAEFFKKFLDVKGTFRLPSRVLHTRVFNCSDFVFGPWDGKVSEDGEDGEHEEHEEAEAYAWSVISNK